MCWGPWKTAPQVCRRPLGASEVALEAGWCLMGGSGGCSMAPTGRGGCHVRDTFRRLRARTSRWIGCRRAGGKEWNGG